MSHQITIMPATYFAPPERASVEELRRMVQSVSAETMLLRALEAMPCPAIVLNSERQVIYANKRLQGALGIDGMESIVGMRPGEVLGCIHAGEGPNGCGTSEACSMCGAVNAILQCQKRGEMVTDECRISIENSTVSALDFEVSASSFELDCGPVTVCALRDISNEKRRRVLERFFFHDVMNTAVGVQGMARLIAEDDADEATDHEYKQMLLEATEMLLNEIREHRQLMLAENGELKPECSEIDVLSLLIALKMLLSNHEVAQNRYIVVKNCPELELCSDITLLRRVLINMLKNALEATPEGGEVSLWCEDRGERIAFHVQNPTVMTERVAKQIFQRSFSTKGSVGRGIGTYSMKLLGERFLKGKISFTSQPPEGTIFTLELPKVIEG